jgi:hypothetical protein
MAIIKMACLDWHAMKLYQKMVYTLPIFYFIYGMPSALLVIPLGVLYGAIMSSWPFSVEEKGDLNRLYLTLPVKKSDIVAGRYFFSLVIFMVGIAMGTVIMFIVNSSSFPLFVGEKIVISGTLIIILITVTYLLYAILMLCSFPLFFKFGYQKGKFFTITIQMVIFLISAFAVVLQLEEGLEASQVGKFLGYAAEHMPLVNGILFLAATAILTLSYIISVKAYSSRDF